MSPEFSLPTVIYGTDVHLVSCWMRQVGVCSDRLEFLTRNSHRGAGDSRRRNPRKQRGIPCGHQRFSGMSGSPRGADATGRRQPAHPGCTDWPSIGGKRARSALTLNHLRKLRGRGKGNTERGTEVDLILRNHYIEGSGYPTQPCSRFEGMLRKCGKALNIVG